MTIIKGFPDIADSFCSPNCSGLKLQNTDSWTAHHVISDFLLINQLILPVHDSFIVQRKNLIMLIESMDAAYKRVANTTSKTYMKMNIIQQNLLVVRDVSR